MNYELTHKTHYSYGGKVNFSPHIFRMTPRVPFREQIWTVEPEGSLQKQRDVFDSTIFQYVLIGSSSHLFVEHTIRGTITSSNPFDFVLPEDALHLPVAYIAAPQKVIHSYQETFPQEEVSLWQKKNKHLLPQTTDTIQFLTSLIQNIHQNFSYEPRETPGVQPPEQTLKIKSGSCRDFAALLLLILRQQNLACRFVSGYLLTSPENQQKGSTQDEAMHAWVDIYLPGAGWLGLDPTNGVLCDHFYIPCAVSLNPEGAYPVEGKYYSDQKVSSTMKTSLTVTFSN